MRKRAINRIGRVAKGEVVICQMISEDLQDMHEKMHDLIDDGSRANEIDDEEKSEESMRTLELIKTKVMIARCNFWDAVHEKYGHWRSGIGIRDGYALVTMPEKKNSIKKMLRDLADSAPDFGMDDDD